jgi:hypothetical protein
MVIDEGEDEHMIDPEVAERVRAAFDRIGEQPAVSARVAIRQLRELRASEVLPSD